MGGRRLIFRRRILAAADCFPGRLATAVLLGGALQPCSCTSPGTNHYDRESQMDNSPGALQWTVAVVLVVALVGGLVRVYRVLQTGETIAPMSPAPEGMRPVECGACRTPQYVSSHGCVFICFCCHSANRVPVELAGLSVREELVWPTGPLKIFEFIKGGDNFWQEITQKEVEEGQETSAAIAERDLPTVIGRRRDPNSREIEMESNHSGRSGRSDCGCLSQCVVCLDAPGTMVLLPCAHGSVCEECTTRIVQNRASGGAHCPHCRSNIKTLVKITELEGTKAKGIEFRIPMARPSL